MRVSILWQAGRGLPQLSVRTIKLALILMTVLMSGAAYCTNLEKGILAGVISAAPYLGRSATGATGKPPVWRGDHAEARVRAGRAPAACCVISPRGLVFCQPGVE
jgi:hypothetical protein